MIGNQYYFIIAARFSFRNYSTENVFLFIEAVVTIRKGLGVD